MRLIDIIPGQKGKFISRYDLVYETANGRRKVYEMISRRDQIASPEELNKLDPQAVIIIVYDDEGRILLNHEFRMAPGGWLYNFPAGLIDEGETAQEAAKRELWEETGLNLDEITDIIGRSYSAIGFSDESTLTVIGKASGNFAQSSSDEEEIEAGWYTKEEVRALLKTQPFAARTQAWCYLWANS